MISKRREIAQTGARFPGTNLEEEQDNAEKVGQVPCKPKDVHRFDGGSLRSTPPPLSSSRRRRVVCEAPADDGGLTTKRSMLVGWAFSRQSPTWRRR